ncbi:MAG TPA: sigma factor-like helix-turn-helix DNA-binding protein [Symbiobacteriaceae bacterium]|jgi:hypothetical protein
MRNFGRGCLREVLNALDSRGLQLRPEGDGTAVPRAGGAPGQSLAGWLDICLDDLTAHQRQVICLRYGLSGNRPLTSEAVGLSLGIPEHRIRSIEEEAFHRLTDTTTSKRWDELCQVYVDLLSARGGVLLAEDIADFIQAWYSVDGVDPVAFTRFTLKLCPGLADWGNDLWAVPQAPKEPYWKCEFALAQVLSAAGRPLPREELLDRARQKLGDTVRWPRDFVSTCLRSSSGFLVESGWCFLRTWRPEAAGDPAQPEEPPDLSDEPIEALDLSVRPYNCLVQNGIKTVGELCELEVSDLLAMRNLGHGSVREVLGVLARKGLRLRDAGGDEPLTTEEAEPSPPQDLAGWLDSCLGHLTERQDRVLRLRNGLTAAHFKTLEETGKSLGVTRERIRQIESKALRRLRHPVVKRKVEGLRQVYEEILTAHGGVLLLEDIAGSLQAQYPDQGIEPVAFTRFTLKLCPGLVDWGKDLWALSRIHKEKYRECETALVKELTESGVPLLQAELLDRTVKRLADPVLWPRDFVDTCLRSSAELALDSGRCFRQTWERSKKARWIVGALHQVGRPAHFTRIAVELQGMAPHLVDVSAHAVHSMLLRIPEIVRVGAGTFALAKWGVREEVSDQPVPAITPVEDEELDPVEDLMKMIFPEG